MSKFFASKKTERRVIATLLVEIELFRARREASQAAAIADKVEQWMR